MKNILLILSLILPLTACDKVTDTVLNKIEENMPELGGSEQQNAKAEILYQALINRDQTEILSLSEPNIREELSKNPNALKSVFDYLPDHVAENPEIVATTKAIEVPYGKITKIGYKYVYPDQTIIFSVVYSGHEGGDKIVGFWVQEMNVQQ